MDSERITPEPLTRVRSKEDAVREVLNRPEFKAVHSPTKKVKKYQDEEEEKGYPKINIKTVCKMVGLPPSTYFARKKCLRQGYPYGKKGRHPFLNPQESAELLRRVTEAAEQHHCMTKKEVLRVANTIRSRRCVDSEEHSICPRTIDNWLKKNSLLVHMPMTSYAVATLSNRSNIAKMYDNIQLMMLLYHYPDRLIFNMDETWVNTEKKVSRQRLVHTVNTRPIALQPKEGQHITLIGCVSKNAEVVEPSYIVPKLLDKPKLVEKYHLENVKVFQQNSGFMTGDIMARWIREVLGPHIQSRREHPGQRALLICDSHVSTWSCNVKRALTENRIDMIVLPPHVTSIFQPLDKFIFKSFKEAYRSQIKMLEKGGKYSVLELAEDSFRIATTKRNIDNSWEQSKLFTKDVKSILNEFEDTPSSSSRSRGSEIISCTPYVEICKSLL